MLPTLLQLPQKPFARCNKLTFFLDSQGKVQASASWRPSSTKAESALRPSRLLYWIYEQHLLRQIDSRLMLPHVGIILELGAMLVGKAFGSEYDLSRWR